jgi:DNA polymerase IV
MRQISREQRESIDKLHQLFMTLCTNLEKRMVNEGVFCGEISFSSHYEDGYEWKDHIITSKPIQDGIEMMNMIKTKMQKFQEINKCEEIINSQMTSMSITVSKFIPEDAIEYEMFSKDVVKNNLRKIVYSIKDKFGTDKIMRAIELQDESILKDVIGFGSVKDLHQSQS